MTQAQFTYSAFGLVVHSNLPVPGLIPIHPASTPSVHFHLGVSPELWNEIPAERAQLAYTSAYFDEKGGPMLRAWRLESPPLLHLVYSTGMQFWIDQHGENIWAIWPEASSLEQSADFLLGPAFGALLRLRGYFCLHASAVALNGRAAVFVGPPGAGKSTTAAIFAQFGSKLLADDIVTIVKSQTAFDVVPAYPYVALWRDSAHLVGRSEPLSQSVAELDKCRFGVEDKFAQHPVSLRAIYVLEERTAQSESCIAPVAIQLALERLLANSYATAILSGNMRVKEIEFLGHLISTVPVRSIRVPEDPLQFPVFLDLVLRDISSSVAHSDQMRSGVPNYL